MVTDANGTELKAGDRVTIECEVVDTNDQGQLKLKACGTANSKDDPAVEIVCKSSIATRRSIPEQGPSDK